MMLHKVKMLKTFKGYDHAAAHNVLTQYHEGEVYIISSSFLTSLINDGAVELVVDEDKELETKVVEPQNPVNKKKFSKKA